MIEKLFMKFQPDDNLITADTEDVSHALRMYKVGERLTADDVMFLQSVSDLIDHMDDVTETTQSNIREALGALLVI